MLEGLIQFEFAPAPNVTLSQVRICFNTGGCAVIYNPNPDGNWRTTMLAGSLTAGPATATVSADEVDTSGATLSFTLGSFPVTIDTTSIPLTVAANPDAGTAPLATQIALDTSDPGGLPLSYQVDFGDGTPDATGTIATPYPELDLDHTYAEPGVYQVAATVSDGVGGAAASTTTVTTTASTAPPVASLSLTPTSGTAPLTVSARSSVGPTPVEERSASSSTTGMAPARTRGSCRQAPSATPTSNRASTSPSSRSPTASGRR